jgi:omega-6 fatty acid desaturase (delta-12 desaturase)
MTVGSIPEMKNALNQERLRPSDRGSAAVPTGALLVRVFIVQHDCGHGSFFASKRANVLVGRMCSLITMTPFANWSHQHSLHHADWNNLDRKGVPFDTPRAWVRERWSVHLTNAALICLFGMLVLLLGWHQVLLVHLPIMVVASILGVWLFSLQHRFETAHWTVRGQWSFVDAALRGSSWFNLPRPVHWLTANIGFHHVHHLNPRVPSYWLAEAHHAVQALRPVAPLSVGRGLTASLLTLWDERRGRLVRFRDAPR